MNKIAHQEIKRTTPAATPMADTTMSWGIAKMYLKKVVKRESLSEYETLIVMGYSSILLSSF